ncbi:kicstor complex protein c12orf66 [Anaeramoeba flamelloides]|uniref:Kicstor complex protein c12orf66 n=1 Tax=Anaeramoeba flamelloides TaxID=1746091 RepID=A0ABQ8ZAF1_9EUKA|nr:kicstor complex protein c12orf66 [Anaeramoeba flamelloides]
MELAKPFPSLPMIRTKPVNYLEKNKKQNTQDEARYTYNDFHSGIRLILVSVSCLNFKLAREQLTTLCCMDNSNENLRTFSRKMMKFLILLTTIEEQYYFGQIIANQGYFKKRPSFFQMLEKKQKQFSVQNNNLFGPNNKQKKNKRGIVRSRQAIKIDLKVKYLKLKRKTIKLSELVEELLDQFQRALQTQNQKDKQQRKTKHQQTKKKRRQQQQKTQQQQQQQQQKKQQQQYKKNNSHLKTTKEKEGLPNLTKFDFNNYKKIFNFGSDENLIKYFTKLLQFLKDLVNVYHIRLEMLTFYKKIIKLNNNPNSITNINYDTILNLLSCIKLKFLKDAKKKNIIFRLEKNITFEINILLDLFYVQHAFQNFSLVNSLFKMYNIKLNISKWKKFLSDQKLYLKVIEKSKIKNGNSITKLNSNKNIGTTTTATTPTTTTDNNGEDKKQNQNSPNQKINQNSKKQKQNSKKLKNRDKQKQSLLQSQNITKFWGLNNLTFESNSGLVTLIDCFTDFYELLINKISLYYSNQLRKHHLLAKFNKFHFVEKQINRIDLLLIINQFLTKKGAHCIALFANDINEECASKLNPPSGYNIEKSYNELQKKKNKSKLILDTSDTESESDYYDESDFCIDLPKNENNNNNSDNDTNTNTNTNTNTEIDDEENDKRNDSKCEEDNDYVSKNNNSNSNSNSNNTNDNNNAKQKIDQNNTNTLYYKDNFQKNKEIKLNLISSDEEIPNLSVKSKVHQKIKISFEQQNNKKKNGQILLGLRKYPCIFSYPSSSRPSGSDYPNLVSLIVDSTLKLRTGRIVYFYDRKIQITYFLLQIEPQIVLVITFKQKRKRSKDKQIITFMQKLRDKLRCLMIFKKYLKI